MKIRNRVRLAKLKQFFTDKPEGNIWKRATIYLVIMRYVGPLSLFLSIPLLAGLLVPSQDMVFDSMGETLSTSFTLIMETLYQAGSEIAEEQPIFSKFLVLLLANMVWVIYAGLFYFLIDVLRHITSWFYSKFNKDKK